MQFSGRTLGLVAAACLSVGACNMNKMTADMTSGPVRIGSIALDRESDLIFAEQAIPASLKTVESFLVNSPENEDLLFILAKGYNAYALGFVERELEKERINGTEEKVNELTRRAVLHYLRAREYGFRVLNMPALEKAARAGDLPALKRELVNVTKEDAGNLFWTTYGWAGAANLDQADPDMVSSLSVIELLIARVVELDPHYEASSPLVFMGVYYASKPTIAGGDPNKAREFFDRAMKKDGERNLLIPYMFARYYGFQAQDKQLFDAMMEKVLTADVTQHPDLRLLNEISRDLARFWVAHSDELILE